MNYWGIIKKDRRATSSLSSSQDNVKYGELYPMHEFPFEEVFLVFTKHKETILVKRGCNGNK